jgi:DNA-binding transcriptional ArsR family regulator
VPEPAAEEADVFTAIASPVRRALLDALATGPMPVHDLAAGFSISRPAVSQHLRILKQAELVREEPISRPAVSQHLRILKQAELVREERYGRERRYQLNPAPLREVHTWIAHYEGFWRDRLSALRDVLDEQP